MVAILIPRGNDVFVITSETHSELSERQAHLTNLLLYIQHGDCVRRE